MSTEGTNGRSNGDARVDSLDPFARGVWVQTNLNGFAALVLVDGSEGREEAVRKSMMDQLQERRFARVELRRKYMLKEIVFPSPFVNGRRTDRLFPGSLPSSGRHASTLELAHEFVSHATLRTLSFLDWFDPEDVEMFRESVVNADASADDLSRSLRPGAIHPSLADPFADGLWLLGSIDGTDALICIEEDDEPAIRESDLLEELDKYGTICFKARRKYLLKEILFPQPSGDPFAPFKPMNLPSSGRHETTLDLIHPFNTLTTIEAITFLSEFHPDDVQRLRAWIHYADGQAENKAVEVRMRRSKLIVPSQNTIVPDLQIDDEIAAAMTASMQSQSPSPGSIDSTPIDRFQGRYAFLSNFHLCVVRISPAALLLDPSFKGDVEEYPSSEHAFQAGKTLDAGQRRAIREASLPSAAKRLGGRRGIATLRADWEQVKEQVMLRVLRAKFSSENPQLVELLCATGERPLVEGNTWNDSEWGCVQRGGSWIGQNKLGRILEIVRREIALARVASRGASGP